MTFPLTVFEKYMLFDDSPSYPMDSFRFLRFSGYIDADHFLDSVKNVIRFHPFLSSIIRRDSKLGYVWEFVDSTLFVRRFKSPIAARFPNPERIDIFSDVGFRVYIVEGADEFSVLFQFHHTVSDGLGEMDLIADILQDYNDRSNGKKPKDNPRDLDVSLLSLRGSSGLTLAKYFRFFIDTAFTTNQLLLRFPSPLVPCKKPDLSVPDNEYYKNTVTELSQDETNAFFAYAKKNNVTVNDVLLRDLFLALNGCREEWGCSKSSAWIRLSMPMSLRTNFHKQIPASNNVTMVFLDRRRGDCFDAGGLLRGIARETRWIKRAEQKHVLILSLNICNFLPGGIDRMLRMRECRATAVLSNLGRVFDSLPFAKMPDGRLIVGKATLEEVDATPPIRFGTIISTSALTYAGKLRLIQRYDAKNINQQDAEKLLQTYIKNITNNSITPNNHKTSNPTSDN
ncbi:MAG: condensation domain-containing protein [Planctomycetaceae bacterium]|nr:condensation domain-containing protein [Planctomycetaceae bacterium]